MGGNWIGRRINVQRLKTRPQFQAVLSGQTVAKTAHFALHCCVLDGGSSVQSKSDLFPAQDAWLGAMVPKRWAKRAVTRNAVKRQIYNVGADFEGVLGLDAHLVRLRCAFDRAQYPSASSDALKLAVRLELLQLFSRVREASVK